MTLAIIILALLFIVTRKHYNFSDEDVSNVVTKYQSVVSGYMQYYPMLSIQRILAMILIESNGDIQAIGDAGTAYGLMQVRQAALSDFNDYYQKNYTLPMLLDKYLGIETGMGYLNLKLYKWNDLGKATRAYNAGDDNTEDASAFEYQSKVEAAEKIIKGKLS